MIQKFTIEAVGRSAGVFNPEKLLWLNAHYIKTGNPQRLGELLLPFLMKQGVDISKGPDLCSVIKTLQERARTMIEMAAGAEFYYRSDFAYDPQAAEKFLKPEILPLYEAVQVRLDELENFCHQGIEEIFKIICEEKGIKMGQLGPPVRIALCGGTISPSIFEVIEVLGKKETVTRIKRAMDYINTKC